MSGSSAFSSSPVRLIRIGPERRSVLVRAVAGGFEVIVDQLVGPWVQRRIPGLLALAGDVQMRHAAARAGKILDLQLAQFLAARDKAGSTGWCGRASP